MNLNMTLPSKPEEWCWQDSTSPAALQVSSNYTWQNKFCFNMLIFEKDTVTVIAKWIFNCVLLWRFTFQACCLQRQRQPSCPKTREKRGARQTNEGFLLGQGTTVGWWTENYWGNKIAEKKLLAFSWGKLMWWRNFGEAAITAAQREGRADSQCGRYWRPNAWLVLGNWHKVRVEKSSWTTNWTKEEITYNGFFYKRQKISGNILGE